MSSSDSKVLGVVLLIRHGDRQGFYQDPKSYTPSLTAITPLGNQEEFQVGQTIRALYLDPSSASHIQGINDTIVDPEQIVARADAGGEGGVILTSAMSFLQGLYPANPNDNTTLANGTVVGEPLQGYQYVNIESVEPDNDISLEGFTSCNTFNNATNAFYASSQFKQVASDYADFLSKLPQFLDGRPVTLENMWNIFDFMNVQSIHNAAFAAQLPPTFLAQARHLANFHEYGVFSSPDLKGIGNIAAQTALPSILDGLTTIANTSQPLKILYQAISYKPFLSLFNMTQVTVANPELASIVDYAAAVALEVRQPSSGDPVVRFNFQNGTTDTFHTFNLLGQSGDIPLSTFVDTLKPAVIDSLSEWCTACGNTKDRGCGALALATTQGVESVHLHQKISPVGAGFLGAGLTLAVALIMLIALSFLGLIAFGKSRSRKNGSSDFIAGKA